VGPWRRKSENFGLKAVKTPSLVHAPRASHSFVTAAVRAPAARVAVVTRYLLPEGTVYPLGRAGKEAARGDEAVAAEIEKLLGVDAKFISRFIIVGQTGHLLFY
jgi:hypothetical protein